MPRVRARSRMKLLSPVDDAALAVDGSLPGDLSQHRHGLLAHLRSPRPFPVRNLRKVANGHVHQRRKLLHREPPPPRRSPELALGPRIRYGAGSVNARSRHVASSCNEEAGPPPCRRQSRSNPCPDGRDCLLGWRCCRGEWPVRHPGIKSGAASTEGRVRGKPPESSPGQAPSCIGHRSHPQPESGRRPVRRVWGWGKRDGSPQGSGRRRQRPPCGALPDGTERGCKQSQEGDAPGSRQGTEAPRLPHESSTVACATPAPGHSPVRAEGKSSPRAGAPGGCAPRRPCRAATAFPGPPRPPAIPPFPAGTRAAACPAPWL